MTRKQKSTEGKRVIYNHVNVNRHKYARGSEINLLCVCIDINNRVMEQILGGV